MKLKRDLHITNLIHSHEEQENAIPDDQQPAPTLREWPAGWELRRVPYLFYLIVRLTSYLTMQTNI